MNEFIQMDIFFFITSVAVVLLTIGAMVVLWQFSRILKNVEHVSEQVALESDSIRADLLQMRASIRKGNGKMQSVFKFLGRILKRLLHNKK